MDIKKKIIKRNFEYNYRLLPNMYLASLESSSKTIEQAIEKTGLTIGYPSWGLLYYSLLCSLPSIKKDIIVIETGTNKGFSTIILAQALKDSTAEGFVNTVEIDSNITRIAESNIEKAGLRNYVKFNTEDSLSFLKKFSQSNDHINFAFLDSNHSCRHVCTEFSLIYQKIIACNGKIFFDNTSSGSVASALKIIKKKYKGSLITFENCSWYPPGNAIWQPDNPK
jgi:predicted O-methyltransferase YrrM